MTTWALAIMGLMVGGAVGHLRGVDNTPSIVTIEQARL